MGNCSSKLTAEQITDDQLRQLFAQHCDCRELDPPIDYARPANQHAAQHDCDTGILHDVQIALGIVRVDDIDRGQARERCAELINVGNARLVEINDRLNALPRSELRRVLQEGPLHLLLAKLDAWQGVTNAASPAPWYNGADPCHFDMPEITDRKTFAYHVTLDADAAFIATARTALPALLTTTRRLLSALGTVAEVAVDEALGEAARQMGGAVEPTFTEARHRGVDRGNFLAAAHVSELPTLEVMQLRAEVARLKARVANAVDPMCFDCLKLRGVGFDYTQCQPCRDAGEPASHYQERAPSGWSDNR